MRYESSGDANARLNNTLVSLKTGEPFLIMGCETANSAVGRNLVTKKKETCKLEDINLVPVKLGYINDGGEATYLMRKPTRKYQQGLNRNNLVICPLQSIDKEEDGKPIPRQGVDLAGVPIRDTVMGKYPEIGTAFQRVRSGDVKSTAFSREWAVGTEGPDIILYHKAKVVGFVGNDSAKLLPEFAFLKESLEETFYGKG